MEAPEQAKTSKAVAGIGGRMNEPMQHRDMTLFRIFAKAMCSHFMRRLEN